MKYQETRQQVLDAIVEAMEMGLVHGTSGNIAMRVPGENCVAVTPSGRPYKTMKVEDIAIVTMDGEWIDGPYKPTSEVPMHLDVMNARPDVNATVHTHGMYATIMAMQDEEIQPSTPPQAEFVPVHVVPFTQPGSNDLGEKVVATLGEGRAVLLKNHGMFCCGKDMKAAMSATVYVEEMATTEYYARLLGNFKPMPKEAVDMMQAMIAADQAV